MRAAIVLLFFLTGCQQMEPGIAEAPPDSAAGEVAFELAGPNDAAIIVPVTINGEGPFDFVLDTGATLTCINTALADSLQLPDMQGTIAYGTGVGGGGRMRLVRLDSIRVAAARTTDLPACAIDLGHVQNVGLDAAGLLGLNFLKPFRVTIDFDRSVLILQEP